jgi:hypothetical protein
MNIPYQVTIPEQSFDNVWVARINGAFPIPRKQLVTDPDTGDVTTAIILKMDNYRFKSFRVSFCRVVKLFWGPQHK